MAQEPTIPIRDESHSATEKPHELPYEARVILAAGLPRFEDIEIRPYSANRVEITRNLLDRVSTELTTTLSADEDTDLADTIVNLRQQQDVFQAALSSGNSAVPQSLIDFLR